MKLGTSILHLRQLDWADPISNELKNAWAANFDLIQELGNIWYNRTIVPEKAASLDIETIDPANAGEFLPKT